MAQIVFGYPIDLTQGWEDGTAYTFFLKTDDVKAAQGAKPKAPASLQTLAGQGAADVYPNVVVRREGRSGRDVDRYVEAQKRAFTEKFAAAKLVREGKTKLGGLSAIECEYAIALDPPLPAIAQWHLFIERDESFYQFCGTSTKQRFAADKKAFRALAGSWAGGK